MANKRVRKLVVYITEEQHKLLRDCKHFEGYDGLSRFVYDQILLPWFSRIRKHCPLMPDSDAEEDATQ